MFLCNDMNMLEIISHDSCCDSDYGYRFDQDENHDYDQVFDQDQDDDYFD